MSKEQHVYFDNCVIVKILNREQDGFDDVSALLHQQKDSQNLVIYSSVTIYRECIKIRNKNIPETRKLTRDFIRDNLTLIEYREITGELTQELLWRAEENHLVGKLKASDAEHLASALSHRDISVFYTYDQDLIDLSSHEGFALSQMRILERESNKFEIRRPEKTSLSLGSMN